MFKKYRNLNIFSLQKFKASNHLKFLTYLFGETNTKIKIHTSIFLRSQSLETVVFKFFKLKVGLLFV